MHRLLFAALLLATGPALADGCGQVRPFRFTPGQSGGEVGAGVVRGELACYALRARAGQSLTASVQGDGDDNAVFQIYAPGWIIGSDGGPRGTTLPGAAEGQDARRFNGRLPANGDYLVVVGATRGNAGFTLKIGIR